MDSVREPMEALERANQALQVKIAHLRETEETLRRNEEQYRTFFENAVEGIFLTTPEGRYLRANPMLARIYGYATPEELMADLTDIAGQLYVDPNRRTEFMTTLQIHDAVWSFESQTYRRDGSVIWISENARAVRDAEGRLLGYEGTVVDITARKRAEEELARARRREVEIGARIQKSLLLGQPPNWLPGAQAAALTIPSQQIDGDFYDFLDHNDRCFDVVVGDVMGKGVPAALLGAAVKNHLLQAMSRLMYVFQPGQLPEPEEVVNWMHGELTAQFIELNVFATLCYMRFDMDTRSVLAVDAGHTKTIHFQRRSNQFQMLEGENMPLGCNEHEVYRQFSAPFEEGDLFMFYSDGVTEAKNPTGEFFGVERVLDFVRENLTLSPESLVERLREAVIAYSGSAKFADDLTCVVVRIASEKE